MRASASLRAACVLFACATFSALAQSRMVAITVDDLPCANCSPINPDGTSQHGSMEATNRRLLAALVRAKVPVTGFVVTATAEDAGEAGRKSLQLWLDNGFDLGSHSYSHPDFSQLSSEQMEGDIARADATLRPLLVANRRQLQFFRFPYNHTGDTQAKHDQMAAYLKEHGYEVATCTIDTSDYVFARAYARALGAVDRATADRIREEYLRYSATEIDYYANLNRRVLGYEPPEVMLLHDSLLNADTADEILALFRHRGYHFVSLAAAQHDPAYSAQDSYITAYGPMWGYRWAAERHLGPMGADETDPPAWITAYADGKPVAEPAAGRTH